MQQGASAAVDPAHLPAAGTQLLGLAQNVGPASLATYGDERRVFAQDQCCMPPISGNLVLEPALKAQPGLEIHLAQQIDLQGGFFRRHSYVMVETLHREQSGLTNDCP